MCYVRYNRSGRLTLYALHLWFCALLTSCMGIYTIQERPGYLDVYDLLKLPAVLPRTTFPEGKLLHIVSYTLECVYMIFRLTRFVSTCLIHVYSIT